MLLKSIEICLCHLSENPTVRTRSYSRRTSWSPFHPLIGRVWSASSGLMSLVAAARPSSALAWRHVDATTVGRESCRPTCRHWLPCRSECRLDKSRKNQWDGGGSCLAARRPLFLAESLAACCQCASARRPGWIVAMTDSAWRVLSN